VALALLDEALDEERAPLALSRALGRAARLTDGEWCGLLRKLYGELSARAKEGAKLVAFVAGPALAELVVARNAFAHEGASGDDAPERLLALMGQARMLLAAPLCVIEGAGRAGAAAAVAEGGVVVQRRTGQPLRSGAWRRWRGEQPNGLAPGAYLALDNDWLRLSPWLPMMSRRVLLMAAPHAVGKPWRMLDPETGERRPSPALHQAEGRLLGDDNNMPVAFSERPALVGREELLSVMRRTAELAAMGGVYLLVLTAPQGIGRGRMLEEMAQSAPSFGFATVIEASCSQARSSPLRPLRRALAGEEALTEVANAVAMVSAGDALAGRAGLEAAVEAVEEALVGASLNQSLLLTLDDAQWADDPTYMLLSLLVERATRKAAGNMLVVISVRDEPHPPVALQRFIGEVERDVGPTATRLVLAALTQDKARQLAQQVAPLSAQLERAAVRGAGGAPFYIVQSLLAWFETGALRWEDGAWHAIGDVADAAVPGMADVVRARLLSYFEQGSETERLAQSLLLCLGLAGGWLSQTQLLAVAGRMHAASDIVENVLETLVDCGMLAYRQSRREYGFAQDVVRRAIMEALRNKPWAARWQRALLDETATHNSDEDAIFLALGYRELGDIEAAKKWFDVAVDYGMRVALFQQAADWAEQRAHISSDAQAAARARLTAAEAWLLAGDPPRAAAALAKVSPGTAKVDIRRRVVALAVAAARGQPHHDVSLVDDADRASVEAGVRARIALARQQRGQRGLALVEEAISRLSDDTPAEVRYRAVVTRFELLVEVRTPADPACREALLAARAAAVQVGSRWAQLDADNDRAVVAMANGDEAEALALLSRVVHETRTHHFGSMHRGALVNMATVHLRAERHDKAAGIAEQAANAARKVGDQRIVAMAQSVRADALRKRGKLAQALVA
ncbi:MAG TPA: ATP-binding protein, partial [Sorangium sp.]|nr:ATP-binding protein [Sorangium sp.]